MKRDVIMSVPSPLWTHASQLAAELGHHLDRDVVEPALLDYVRIQAEVLGRVLGRCSACNATTLDGECVECGWKAAAQVAPAGATP